ncbi:MAG: eL32 family ribosomal protein [archaeon]
MVSKDIVDKRNEAKAKKPRFIRQDAHKKKRVGSNWKRPRGIDSKLRLHLKGHRKSPGKGYRSPAEARGLSHEGLVQVIVENATDVATLDPKKDGAILSGQLGQRKRVELVRVLIEKGITILNIPSPDAYLKAVEETLQKKKDIKAKREQNKKSKEEEKKKKAEEKEKKDSEKEKPESSEDKEKAEKKEKDKVLVTKEGGM